MELLQLKYFLAAAGFEHMTKAADSLHISQPALTRSIKRLEKELNTRLFVQEGRSVRLSDQGVLLAEKLTPIMKAIDALPGELAHAAETAEKTISLNILSASEMITNIIILYKEQHPEVNFQISQKIDSNDWDIRISTILPREDASAVHAAFREEIFLAVPADSPFAGKDEITLKDASAERFITMDSKRPLSLLTSQYCRACGFEPEVVFTSDNPAAVKNLIGAGMGVGFWPALSWGRLPGEKVKLLHISEPSCMREIYAVRKNDPDFSPLKEDFYSFLLNRLAHAEKHC